MTKAKKNLVLVMLAITAVILAIIVTVTSQYKDIYTEVASKEALEKKALYFENYQKYIDLGYDENIFFKTDYLILKRNYQVSEVKQTIRQSIDKSKIEYNTISLLTNDFGNYYLYPIKVKESQFLEHLGIEKPTKNKDDEIDIIIYTDTDYIDALVFMVHITFAIALFIAIILAGFSGFYLGSKIERDQAEIKHLFQNSSHELKTPLMSIEGYAKGIETGVITDYKMASNVIIKQSKKMQQLIDEILNISKLESKNYILKKDTVDIRDVIDDSMQNFRQVIKKKNLKVDISIDEANPLIVGDHLQLYKAINTVIDNSFKFAETEVIIKTFVNEIYLSIEIFNDGNRIKRENLDHIFERFYSKDDFSSGIGLAMAKEIVDLSKGRISVLNRKNGVSFMIDLPRQFN